MHIIIVFAIIDEFNPLHYLQTNYVIELPKFLFHTNHLLHK